MGTSSQPASLANRWYAPRRLSPAEEPDRTARVGELAEALSVPQNYLSKTLHQLARTGILVSTRGKHGGFRLSRPPETIPLFEIVAPFERIADQRQCLLGRRSAATSPLRRPRPLEDKGNHQRLLPRDVPQDLSTNARKPALLGVLALPPDTVGGGPPAAASQLAVGRAAGSS
jgi:Rrf2 family protein